MTAQVIWYGDDILNTIGGNLGDALFQGAKIVQEAAQSKAPAGSTGRLKRGIYAASATKNNYVKIGKRNRRKKVKDGEAIVASGAFYGGFVEYGTAKNKAKPYLRPALDETGGRALEVAAAYLTKELDKLK